MKSATLRSAKNMSSFNRSIFLKTCLSICSNSLRVKFGFYTFFMKKVFMRNTSFNLFPRFGERFFQLTLFYGILAILSIPFNFSPHFFVFLP